MEAYKIPHNRNGHYSIFSTGDIEFADPIIFYEECFIKPRVIMQIEKLEIEKPEGYEFLRTYIPIIAKREWQNYYQKLINTEIPPNFIELISSDNISKKDQVKLLKGQSITPEQLIAFIFYAFTKLGFSFSQYSAQHYHNGIENEIIPNLVVEKDNEIDSVGETTLSKGQLKNLIQHRKRIVSKFFDKGNTWHCFFISYKSLRGEETWKNGKAHFHYISDKFGLDREIVKESLKSKYYNLGSLPHIDLNEYTDKRGSS